MGTVRWRRAGDLAVLGALAVFTALGALVGIGTGGHPARVWIAAAAELLSVVVLAARRRHPAPVLAVATACAVVASAVTDRTVIGPLLPGIALYSLATVSTWKLTAAAATGVLGAYCAGTLVGIHAATVTAAAAICCVAAAIGMYIGEHRRLLQRAETEHQLRSAQAVVADRLWIARELHDAIGHHVSLLVVQAGAVRTTLTEDHPGWPALTSMIEGGREAMKEMRRLVDVLRPVGDAPDDLDLSPGLAAVPTLCDRLRAGGLPVDLRLDVPTEVSRTAGTTAYRIVQEALTNVVKHAGDVPTRVDIRCTGPFLDLRVTNARAAGTPPAEISSAGHGLEGIRRRAALFGGEVFAGPVPGGGYALRATLRLREAA